MKEELILQDSLWRVIQVVELSATGCNNEQHQEHGTQEYRDRQEEKNRVHELSSRTLASTREAPQITMALESGIRMAATSGFTYPAAAAPTAMMLYPIERA
jgi:hypothetical protein